MKIFNSLKSEKEDFIPLKEEEISIYVCGMTVYDDCHIGHARTFLSFDSIVRYLRFRGFKVNYIRNITDVDDKILKRSEELNIEPSELTQKYIEEMDNDFESLSMITPDLEPRATENIDSIINLISKLIEKGNAYVTDSDVFFDTASYLEYGKLSNRKIEELISGSRVEVDPEKKNKTDFVLWKRTKEGLNWDSPWGPGRPGWHIECSAMSMDALGETFDIHGGGLDLKFPHHENEIAQSECATNKEFARYWMHTGPLRIEDEKMSKSLGNYITIKDALRNFSSEALRFFLLSTHYRNPINFKESSVKEAQVSLNKLYTSLAGLDLDKEISLSTNESKKEFMKVMDDDFNIPGSLAVLFNLSKEINVKKDNGDIEEAIALAKELIDIAEPLGLLQQNPEDYLKTGVNVSSDEIDKMIAERSTAREKKDFKEADRIRDELQSLGVVLEDSNNNTTWRRA
jgi:cysteinyl-tRNA synthetase|tara:strand:+ start:466 stop:1839 length:1374 start_codon:yes stop_codon:yes gene_type:complete